MPIEQTSSWTLRGPNGRIHRVRTDGRFATVGCQSVDQVAGQWIVFAASPSIALIGGLHHNRLLDRVDRSLVFESSLDEAGEDYIVIVASDGLKVVRITLDTVKLALSSHYQYIEHLQSLMGVPEAGASGVSGHAGSVGRRPDAYEHGFQIVCRAADLYDRIESVRSEIPQHARGTAGRAGLDVLRTLEAWKANPSWYRPASARDSSPIKCGQHHLVPLRAVPRVSIGGNLFFGAVVSALSDLVRLLPASPAAQTAAGILQLASRRLQSMDLVSPCSSTDARRILAASQLPTNSAALVAEVAKFRDVATAAWKHCPLRDGGIPFAIAPAPSVFQQVAVLEVLLSLGMDKEAARQALDSASTAEGAAWGEYRAWVDCPLHGLHGWRDRSRFPSDYRPDLVIHRSGDGAWLLIDAKLRLGRSDSGLLSASGVKDLQAYMQEFGLRLGVLVVQDSAGIGCRVEDVAGDGCRVRAIALPSHSFEGHRRLVREYLETMWNVEEFPTKTRRETRQTDCG